MKNFKLRRTAAIIGYTVLAVVLFASCGNEPPVINDKNNPFIIGEISKKNETHSISYKHELTKNGTSFFGSWYEAIILPTGMYNVGDTIYVRK